MPDELNQVGSDDAAGDSIGTDDAAVDTGDGGLDATPAEDQVAQSTTDAAPREQSLEDVPEEFRPMVEAKLKNLESGYTKKYQTLAEEKRAFEAERDRIMAAGQQTQPSATTDTPENPFANVDWEYETDATKALYNALGQVVQYIQQADGKLQTLDSYHIKQQVEQDLRLLRDRYGDFDEDTTNEIMELAVRDKVPLKYAAAEVLGPREVEKAKQSVYGNVEAKRRANAPASSGAKTVPDAKVNSIWDAFNLAKKGIKL